MNNGITIVAKKISKTGYTFKISDFQVVNGCQTSHVIYHSKGFIGDSTYVPLKLIVAEDYDVINHIIKATNKQTEVKNEAFEILSPFHKTLEEFYAAQSKSSSVNLLYERRSQQHAQASRKEIITLSNQITSFLSMFLLEPHSTMRYYGELLRAYKSKMFIEGHSAYPYYLSGLALNRVESMLYEGKIANSLKRFKYHFLMMLRLNNLGFELPQLHSIKKIDSHCRRLNDILDTSSLYEAEFQKIEAYITNKLHSTKLVKRHAHELRAFTEELHPTSKDQRERGKISYYNEERGFGFIITAKSSDVFFHIKDYQKNIPQSPSIGEELIFDAVDSDNGLRAINIEAR